MVNFLKNMPAPILMSPNCNMWAHKMKIVLLLNGAWDLVETEFKQLKATVLATLKIDELKVYKDLQHKDLQAKCMIEGCMEENFLPRIMGASNAHQAWKILETTYKGIDQVKIVRVENLRQEFENLKMKECRVGRPILDMSYKNKKSVLVLQRAFGYKDDSGEGSSVLDQEVYMQ